MREYELQGCVQPVDHDRDVEGSRYAHGGEGTRRIINRSEGPMLGRVNQQRLAATFSELRDDLRMLHEKK